MEETIKEKNIQDYPLPITMEKMHKIIEQMKNCICKLILKGNVTGTGFFCNIKYNDELYQVLITNFHIIDDKYLENNQEICCSINNNEKNLIIKKNQRKLYFNKEYDITILEIKELDGIKNYLDLDDNLFKENSEICYDGITVYDIHYPKSENVSVSFGIIRDIKNSCDIIHLCSTDFGSSGSPILNLKTNKVIGIHKEASIHFNFNVGTFLKNPIKEYIEQNIEIKNPMIPMITQPTPPPFYITLLRLKEDNFEFKEVSSTGDLNECADKCYWRYNYNIYFGCWNEVLRCLCYIDEFYNYFKDNEFCENNGSFLSLFKIIIDNMELKKNSNYKFNKVIYFGKIFKELIDQNSKNDYNLIKEIIEKLWLSPYELIIFILLHLHEDLKKNKKYNNFKNDEVFKIQKEFNISGIEKENINKETYTIIGNYFFGLEKRTLKNTNFYGEEISKEKIEFSTVKVVDYTKYIYYKEHDYHYKHDDDDRMQNPIFRIMFEPPYAGPKEEIEYNYHDKDNLILPPKIIIGGNNIITDFKLGDYDYTLFGIIGDETEKRYIYTETINDNDGTDDYWDQRMDGREWYRYIEHYKYIRHFYCFCKDLKTNRWFKYEDNQIIEIKIDDIHKKFHKKIFLPLLLYKRIEK